MHQALGNPKVSGRFFVPETGDFHPSLTPTPVWRTLNAVFLCRLRRRLVGPAGLEPATTRL